MAETDFSIRSFKGGYDDNLTYLASCMRTGNQFLVDASVPLAQIDGFINKRGLIALFITHTHGDHIAFLEEYLEAFPNLVVMVYKESESEIKFDYIKPVKEGDIITISSHLFHRSKQNNSNLRKTVIVFNSSFVVMFASTTFINCFNVKNVPSILTARLSPP